MDKLNKVTSLIIIGLMYFFAISCGYLLAILIPTEYHLQLFLADIFATLIIYVFSVIFKNTSIYDPYWSIVPWVLITIEMIYYQNFSIPAFILYIPFTFWSWRLTINWIITFKGMGVEDWRYSKYRNKYPRVIFELINFFGLQMMPTLLVLAGLYPYIYLVRDGTNYFSIIGAVFILGGTILELVSDHQMHKFLKEVEGKMVCEKGLWNYSRHPNYLGEILIWVGLGVTHVIQYPTMWFTSVGFILVFILFNFISIPLMENRQLQRRPDYETYRKTTSKLFILPKKRLREEVKEEFDEV